MADATPRSINDATPWYARFARGGYTGSEPGGLVADVLDNSYVIRLSDEDRELLKQILLATKSLKPEEAPKRLQEPADDLGSKSDYGLAS